MLDEGEVQHYICARCGSMCSTYVSTDICPACELKGMGIKDPDAWKAALEESGPYISPSRDDTLNSILQGLLRNEPGLTTNEQETPPPPPVRHGNSEVM